MATNSSPRFVRFVSLALAATAVALGGCGDASGTSSGNWHNVGGTGGTGADPNAATDPGTPGTPGTPGSPGTPGTPGTPGAIPSFTVTLDKATADTELRSLTNVNVTVTPVNGFTGSVTLVTSGLPTGVTASFMTPTVTINSAAAASTTLSFDTPSTASITSAAAAVKVTGNAGTLSAVAPIAYTVKPILTITIPNNIAGLPDNNVFGASPIVVNAGGTPIAVEFVNADTSSTHIIHSNNTTNGFFHGDTTPGQEIASGGKDKVRMVTGVGNYSFYLHDESSTARHNGAVKIQ